MSKTVQKKARLVLRHDIEANWLKADNCVPDKGELVVYDADEIITYPRFKIGDGEHIVRELPFTTIPLTSNNSIIGPTTKADDGYAVSLGYENIAIPFEKEMGIDDYSITSEPIYYFDENEQLIFSDSKIDEGIINGRFESDESGSVELIPQVLYYNTTNIQDLTIYVEFVEGNQSWSEYTCEVTTDGRTKVSLYPAYDYYGDRMYKILPCQYSITFKKTLPTHCYFGYRFGSVDGETYYEYVNLQVEQFPLHTGVYKSDIIDDASNATGKMIHINYLIPKIEGSNYAPISLGYAGIAGGMGATNLGYRNVSIGNGTLTGGYHNKTISDTGASVGCNNINYGNASFVGGTSNTNNTGNTIVHGSNNIVEKYNSDSAIFGHNNIAEENKNVNTSNLCAGKSNKIKPNTTTTAIFGNKNTVDSINGFVYGLTNTLGGQQSLVGGQNNTNIGINSGVIGSGNNNEGEASVVFGLDNTNTGKGSLISGQSNSANGGRIIVVGKENTVKGTTHGTAVFGYKNTIEASNDHDNALNAAVLCSGRNNKVNASASISIVSGGDNTLNGKGNAIFGEQNTIAHNYSFISGHNCSTTSNYQRIFGKFNNTTNSSNYIDIVAWGGDNNSRKNLYTLDKSGNATFTGMVLCSNVSTKTITIGNTTLTEEDLIKVLRLINTINYGGQ